MLLCALACIILSTSDTLSPPVVGFSRKSTICPLKPKILGGAHSARRLRRFMVARLRRAAENLGRHDMSRHVTSCHKRVTNVSRTCHIMSRTCHERVTNMSHHVTDVSHCVTQCQHRLTACQLVDMLTRTGVTGRSTADGSDSCCHIDVVAMH